MEIYRAMDDINGAIKGTLDLSHRIVFAGVPCSLIRVATRLQRQVSIPLTFSRALGKSRGLQTESESLNPLCNKNSEEPCLCFKR